MTSPSKLDISSNRLSHIGARHLLTHLSPQCLELDAHANRIGVYGCLTISNCILKSQLHELMALNLGMNGLHDEAGSEYTCFAVAWTWCVDH